VVIVGGGFGGLNAAKFLKRSPVDITLIDRRNFHLFQPLLYQVATGSLSPANIASPLRGILKKQQNARVLLGEVIDIDVENQNVILKDDHVEYDSLIVAAGAHHHYFGNDGWAQYAPGLKTIEDATEIRGRILNAFEQAERESDPARRKAWLNFVVVGAGPTGVELAGAISEISKDTLKHDFRTFDPADAEVILVEGIDRVLPPYPEELSIKAQQALEKIGVKVRLRTFVENIESESVTVKHEGLTEKLPTQTVLWAAGVQASSLGKVLAEKTAAELDRAGRLIVDKNLALTGYPNIFVVGDMASYCHQIDTPLPGVCQVAMQQGKYAAQVITAHLHGKEIKSPFRYKDLGSMATIGRGAAVADMGKVKFSGWPAWMAWLFIHVLQLIEFENRLLVMTQWAWNYISRNRSARLITDDEDLKR
jgi:NADH dehydrogenase